jgi:hypothetical protein
MRSRFAPASRPLVVAAIVVAALGLATSATLARAQGRQHYRTYAMGDSLQAISRQLGQPVVDATSTPAASGAVQELRWHARDVREGTVTSGDPVDRLVFSFYEHRLFRIVIDYAPDRTEGMTADDVVAAVSTLYGAPRPRTLTSGDDESLPEGSTETVIARWTRGDQSVALLAIEGQTAFRLIIASAALQRLARASGAREAPADRPDWASIEAAPNRAVLIAGEPTAVTRRRNVASFIP